MRANLALSRFALLATVAFVACVPWTAAFAADACAGMLGELDVAARSCAFVREGAVAPLAMWSSVSAFFAAAAGMTVLRHGILRLRYGGRARR